MLGFIKKTIDILNFYIITKSYLRILVIIILYLLIIILFFSVPLLAMESTDYSPMYIHSFGQFILEFSMRLKENHPEFNFLYHLTLYQDVFGGSPFYDSTMKCVDSLQLNLSKQNTLLNIVRYHSTHLIERNSLYTNYQEHIINSIHSSSLDVHSFKNLYVDSIKIFCVNRHVPYFNVQVSDMVARRIAHNVSSLDPSIIQTASPIPPQTAPEVGVINNFFEKYPFIFVTSVSVCTLALGVGFVLCAYYGIPVST